jgi:glycosyltransferase involved in cell wall biosynthesis
VVHAHFGHSGVFISDIYQLLEIPVVVSFYGQDYSQDLPKRSDVYKRMFSKVDKITAMNQFMQDALINYGCPKEKIEIVRIWAKESFSRPVKRNEERNGNSPTIKILSVGRLTHKKGYFICLDAIAKIKKERKNIIYEIIGEGSLEEEIKKYSREKSLEDVVHFIGAVNREQVKSFMIECDILLLHSITSVDGDMEGTPTVILEVGLLGKPVVSTYHAGIPEIIDHGISGYLTKEGDVDQTVESLCNLIDNEKKRILFGKMLKKKIINEYSEELNCTKFINIYRSILG